MRKVGLLAATIAVSCFGQDYFPLHVGNQWVYRQTGRIAGEPVVVHITEGRQFRTRFFDGPYYVLLQGLPGGPAWLRQDENGVLYQFDPDTEQETVWARFRTAQGETYRTSINPCNGTARVESRNQTVKVPAGEYGGALAISYPGANCADAGLTEDVFLPWIGLVKRTSLTIAGPHTLELAYARVGGVTVLGEPEVSFQLALDKPRYEAGQQVTARFTVRATQSEPLELIFPSGQRFDLVFRNERGDVVYRWSEGRAFTLALGTERIFGERNWVVQAPVPAEPGSYIAEGWLTTTPPRVFRSQIGFTAGPRQ
jgi:hypothetical protein